MFIVFFIIFIVIAFLILGLIINPSYKIKDNLLIIKSGFSKVKIPVQEITAAIKTKNFPKNYILDSKFHDYVSNTCFDMADRILIKTKNNEAYFLTVPNALKLIESIHRMNSNIKILK